MHVNQAEKVRNRNRLKCVPFGTNAQLHSQRSGTTLRAQPLMGEFSHKLRPQWDLWPSDQVMLPLIHE